MNTRGKFITLEGPEGSGKSTHARLIVERMKMEGYSVVSARDPGGTRFGEGIRELLGRNEPEESMCSETELFLFLASRAQLTRKVIFPALDAGVHVVCDRFTDSTMAYQGYGRDCDMEALLKMNDFAVRGLVPDLTLLLDVDVADGFKRVEKRNSGTGTAKDRIEHESMEFHERVRAGYLDLARRNPCRYKLLNAAEPREDVQEKIWEEILRVIKL